MSIRRTSHFRDPKLELQIEELRRAAASSELEEHANRNGGVHGLGPQDVFESVAGAQAKANAALAEARSYTDQELAKALAEARSYTDQELAQALAEARSYTDQKLEQLQQIVLYRQAGPTSNRPDGVAVGTVYFDTTLGKPVWWTGSDWVDAMGDPA
mgnify:CR=1 FL=1